MMTTDSPERTDDGDRSTGSTRDTTRRGYLGALGAVAAAGLAGCSSVFGAETTNGSAMTDSSTPVPSTAEPGTTEKKMGANNTSADATIGQTASADATTVQDGSAGISLYTQVYRNTIGSVALIEVAMAHGTAEGTGFIYDDSHIVTNAHVVSDARAVRLRFSNQEYFDASIVGVDVSSDLAVLEAPIPKDLSALTLHPNQPAIGTRVLAIGNPYGNYGSASAGIVSAVNQSIPAQNGYTIPDAIQTDAAVNPGNSGGPLMNLGGEVLGVVNSVRRNSQNIAFAISAALVKRVVPALIKTGEYHHAYLGVALAPVTTAIARRVGLDRSRGAVVTRVYLGGPSSGTLREGDVIVSLGDQRITGRQQLMSYLALHTSPGDTIDITVIRNGSRKTLELTLGTRPENQNVGIMATTSRR